MNEEVVEREAARAVVFDSHRAVLLQRIAAGSGPAWILPGGGVAPGETHEQAVVRELAEEVGLRNAVIGPWVWERTAEFSFRGVRYRQHERYFLAGAERFEFDHSGLEDVEIGVVLGHRWWSIDDIEAAVRLVFWPRKLGELLQPLSRGILPSRPIPIE